MKTKLPLVDAEKIAADIVGRLRQYCKRIEIAGSVRRRKPEVGDIEIVAIPLPTVDLFGVEMYEPHQLDEVDWSDFGRLVKNGHKYKQIEMGRCNLDLFIVTPPAQWGVQFIIRTGSAEFSHRLVTAKQYGGMMPGYLKVKDGAIWSNNHIVETPEEQDVFDLIGAEFVPPPARLL